MYTLKPKKYLGQHFLTENAIAQKIVNSLTCECYNNVLEIGPGKGILTKFLLNKNFNTYVIEIDPEAINILINTININKEKIIEGDFLKVELNSLFKEQTAIIGNFPYNISSQIIIKIIENKAIIPEVIGMFQKEVAKRIVAKPNTKEYGILSVLTQAYYKTEYLFTVNEGCFFPRPKVKSGLIRLKRINQNLLKCNEILFNQLVKTAFNQRRKILKNSLSKLNFSFATADHNIKDLMHMRAEQLTVENFITLTKYIESQSS